MSKIKQISIIALVLLLVGIVGSVLTFKPMLQQTSVSKEEVIQEQSNRIEITADDAEVEVLSTTDSTAKVDLSGQVGKGAKYHLTTNVENSALIIDVKLAQQNFISLYSSSLSIKVYVPEALYESLQITGDDGHIAVSDLQAGDIHVTTTDGRVEFNNVKGTTLTTLTKDGSSELKNVEAATIQVKSGSGRINLEEVAGQISAETSDGGISLVTSQLDHPLELTTKDGHIHVQTKNKPTNATIIASVEDGHVELFDSSDRHAVFGNGEHTIKLTASDGSITVEEK